MMLLPAKPDRSPPATPARPTALPKATPAGPLPDPSPVVAPPPVAAASHPLATQAAPPAPSAEEWAFAARYSLRNSKAYRYTWGQQVRSLMGTAVEGPDQGMVRFRVEIAPDGSLTRLDTLWSTSAVAERLARQAIRHMPQWPPTPTGRPLVFERTISFSPFASDGPPLYRNDCQPEPTAHRNRFAWDGRSEPRMSEDPPAEVTDPQALEDCLKQLPKDSIEAEAARDQRVMDRWGWSHRQPGQ
jgi:TonB family protein